MPLQRHVGSAATGVASHVPISRTIALSTILELRFDAGMVERRSRFDSQQAGTGGRQRTSVDDVARRSIRRIEVGGFTYFGTRWPDSSWASLCTSGVRNEGAGQARSDRVVGHRLRG